MEITSPLRRQFAVLAGTLALATSGIAALGATAAAAPSPAARTAAQLEAARATLESSARLPGTAWAVDQASKQVVVSVFDNASVAAAARVAAIAGRSAGAIRVVREKGALAKHITGGDAIYGGGYRCSLGFNVRNSGGTYYFLTAGHCTNLASTWYANSARTTVLGSRAGTSFPRNDYGIVRYTNTRISHPGAVGSQDITNARTPSVGETVYRRGSTTGIHRGRVTALNATVNYREGTVTGLIRTTVCAEGGDSGGPLYSGTSALGLTSGGNGNCTSGGTTFFQPVTEPLGVYGVAVY